MKAIERLHDAGQSLWLKKNHAHAPRLREPRGYVGDFSLTGLTSDPTIFGRPGWKTHRAQCPTRAARG
jgi:hypothetical protein